jgi:hypothetical protein
MQLANENLEDFPGIALYLHIFKYQVYNNKKVWNAFLNWSTLDEKSALEALTYGTKPILRIDKDVFKFFSNGHFKCSDPDYINIERLYATNIQGSKSVDIQDLKSFEAIVLHEMVHWARCRNKVDDSQVVKVGDRELDSGDLFKREAYINPEAPWLQ